MRLEQLLLAIVGQRRLREPGFRRWSIHSQPLTRQIFNRRIALVWVTQFIREWRGDFWELPGNLADERLQCAILRFVCWPAAFGSLLDQFETRF